MSSVPVPVSPELGDDAKQTLLADGVASWLLEAFSKLKGRDPDSIAAVLAAFGTEVILEDTKASCRCHFVVCDGNGRPRVDALLDMLARQVQDYCIPRSRREEAYRHFERTGSSAMFSALEREARELFTRIDTSGEGGELLLYLLLETVLGLPQLLCKMPLKTSSQMHVHGVDGVHGNLLEDGTLALYWGESKLYADVNAGIDASFESISPFLLDDGGGEARRDLLLVREHLDPADDTLKEALRCYFDESRPESARIEYRGACLIGFNLEDYPDLARGGEGVREQITARISGWHERIGKRVGDRNLATFELEVFCVPLPSVDEFRDRLRGKLSRG
jgi:hypothetical protein